jgi:general secretion pathway protein A
MYTEYYGLAEKPFALLPDPRFLFLGSSHSEALAHLLYGIDEGEGFILVVGQVGTGKTTLCRALVQHVDSGVTLGFIFNPSSSETELLAAINREFGIPTVARTRDDLIEELNRFLLQERAAGRRALLVIDEAQNLEPEVLEQVRLLSNLETEREKLIQIVLIGQPELDEKLQRSELRQLRQRITVHWRLDAFTRGESAAYLRHRLEVAGARDPELFTRGAVTALHRLSRGVPRVINALADRALLVGYAAGSRRVGLREVRRAARELPSTAGRVRVFGYRAAAGLVAAGAITGIALTGATRLLERSALPPVETAAAPRVVVAEPDSPGAAALERSLLGSTPERSAASALDALLRVWGYPALEAGSVDPNRLASALREISPLNVWSTRLTHAELVGVDLPAMLELAVSVEDRRYATVVRVESNGAIRLAADGGFYRLERPELERLWTGRCFVAWTNFESMPALVAGMTGSAVRWLQARLTDLGYLEQGTASGEFDLVTLEALRRFQGARGIEVTGDVGPETLIALYQALHYGAPQLVNGATL